MTMSDNQEPLAHIIGGLSISEACNGGTVSQISYIPESDENLQLEAECQAALQFYLKSECLDNIEKYEGEPFEAIASTMQKLLTNGKIKKKIIRAGYGPKPESGNSCNIQYNAYVQYETRPFDSTYARKKHLTFVVGNLDIIEGLEIAVLSMQINEKSQFLINPELAYKSGCLARIPANAVVLFEIELISITEPSQAQRDPAINQHCFDVVYPQCIVLREKGKQMFLQQDFTGAIKTYNMAVDKLENAVLKDYEDQQKCEKFLLLLYTNLLVSCTQAQIPKRGCIFAQRIYQMAKDETFEISAKVHFNYAKCKKMLGDFSFALRLLGRAKQLEPNNVAIKNEFAEIKAAREKNQRFNKQLGHAFVFS